LEVIDMPRKWTNLHRNHIVKLYLSGLTQREVAAKVGSDQKQIGKVLREAGVSRSNSSAQLLSWKRGKIGYQYRTGLPIEGIASKYLAGESITSLASAYSIHRRGLKSRLIKYGIKLRTTRQAYALINREQSATLRAKTKTAKVGWGEDILCQWLIDRGEIPNFQMPVGSKNIDLACHPVAVEVWLSSGNPFRDPYCIERIKYLANRHWFSLYVLISRRTRILLPAVADEIIRILEQTRLDPPALRKHWVIRGCGELAARGRRDFNNIPIIKPSKNCPYHSAINKSLRS